VPFKIGAQSQVVATSKKDNCQDIIFVRAVSFTN
jgi:hypothetical protein